jgi:hypothetical protein
LGMNVGLAQGGIVLGENVALQGLRPGGIAAQSFVVWRKPVVSTLSELLLSYTAYERRAYYWGWSGVWFTVGNAALSVRELGRFVDGSDVVSQSQVLLTDATGTVLGSVWLNKVSNAWVWGTLSAPVTLQPNTIYCLVQDCPTEGAIIPLDITSVTLSPDVTIGGYAWTWTGGPIGLTLSAYADPPMSAVNMRYTVVPTARNFITAPGNFLQIHNDGYFAGATFDVGGSHATVSQLGRWWHTADAQNPVIVYLMDASGTSGVVIAQASVPYPGSPERFAYAPITPVTLIAGHTYAIIQDWQDSTAVYPRYASAQGTTTTADFSNLWRVSFWPINGAFDRTSFFNATAFGPLDFVYELTSWAGQLVLVPMTALNQSLVVADLLNSTGAPPTMNGTAAIFEYGQSSSTITTSANFIVAYTDGFTPVAPNIAGLNFVQRGQALSPASSPPWGVTLWTATNAAPLTNATVTITAGSWNSAVVFGMNNIDTAAPFALPGSVTGTGASQASITTTQPNQVVIAGQESQTIANPPAFDAPWTTAGRTNTGYLRAGFFVP